MILRGGVRTLGGPKGRDQGRSGVRGAEPETLGGLWAGLRAGIGGGAKGRSGGVRPVPPERERPAGNGRLGRGAGGEGRGFKLFSSKTVSES